MTAMSPITSSFSNVNPKDTRSEYRHRTASTLTRGLRCRTVAFVASKELDSKFIEEYVRERDDIAVLRENSAELGIDVVSAATGAQLAFVAAAVGATSIIEIGTGLGVSGLWLMSGAPEASFTSI